MSLQEFTGSQRGETPPLSCCVREYFAGSSGDRSSGLVAAAGHTAKQTSQLFSSHLKFVWKVSITHYSLCFSQCFLLAFPQSIT